ncbi:hypothetical protein [Dokdonella soli]
MWLALPWSRFSESLAVVLISLLLAAAMHRLRGWALAHALAAIACAALVFFAGMLPTIATLALAATAIAVGSLLIPQRDALDAVIALPVGLALIGGCLGWLMPLPLHHSGVYLVVAAVLCIWRAQELRTAGIALWYAWQDNVAAAPWHAAAAVLALGLATTGAWLPTMQSDDLGYHLGLPSQLLRDGFYAPDPAQQIWVLAPWLGDVVQGIAEVLAGHEARGAVDTLWMLSAAAALGSLTTTVRTDARIRWLVVALFASMPLLASLVAGMQTELPATALIAAMALVIMRMPGDRLTWCAAVLAGGLFALKFGQAVAALVLLIWALARVRDRVDAKRVAVAILLFLLIAGSSYFHAWRISGNPLLPLFNNVFQSPVMAPHQLDDVRWHAGFSPTLLWAITFDTKRYLEAEPGGYGFVLVAFVGVWLLALWRRETRSLSLAASAIILLPLLPMQYARYAFPGVALLLAPLVITGSTVLGVRRFAYVGFALCLLNFAFHANASWVLSTVARKRLLTNLGDTQLVLQRFAPERLLIAELHERDPTDSVVLALNPEAPYIAELAGRGRTVSWYSPTLEAARFDAETDASGRRWKNLIDATHARWLLLRPDLLSPAQRAALSLGGARQVITAGVAELWSWGDPALGRTALP